MSQFTFSSRSSKPHRRHFDQASGISKDASSSAPVGAKLMTHSTLNPRTHSPAESLRDCLRVVWSAEQSTNLAQLSLEQWRAIVAWAQEQRVAALLYYRLRQQGVDIELPPVVRTQLKAYYQQVAVNNILLYYQLKRLLAALQDEQIPAILLKGAYLGGAVYPEITLRQMVDVDLLVQPEQLAQVIAVVTKLGYQSVQPIGDLQPYLAHKHHLPPFVKANAPSLEIHWSITKPNLSYTIDMTELWLRAQPAVVNGSAVLALAPEDLLLHVCLHATYQHWLEQDIRFLCDIDVICRHFAATFDWGQFTQRAVAWGWHRGVYLALQLAHEQLATPIPAAVLAALHPEQASTLVADAKLRLDTTRTEQSYLTSHDFCEVWEEERLLDRIRKALGRVFIPRDRLASIYPVAANSPKIYLYYGVRLVSLLSRYGGMMLQLQRQQSSDLVYTRKAALVAWLEHGAKERAQTN